MDDRLSANFLFLGGKSIFLSVPVFVSDGTFWNVFGQFRILSDPTKNLGTLKIKNVTPINVKMSAGINQECKEMILISFYTCVIIFDKLGNLWLLHGSYATQCYNHYLPASPESLTWLNVILYLNSFEIAEEIYLFHAIYT